MKSIGRIGIIISFIGINYAHATVVQALPIYNYDDRKNYYEYDNYHKDLSLGGAFFS